MLGGVRLLFLSRKPPGRGGMQRLNRDLARCLRMIGGRGARVCAPLVRWDISFPFRLLADCVFAVMCRDRVHLGDAALAPLGALLSACGCRVSATACGLDVTYPAVWYQFLIRASLPRLRVVICISSATADEVRKRGVPDERIRIIPCGLWPEEIPPVTPVPDLPTLLTVGRLVPRKGVAWFVAEVFPLLRREIPGLRYRIAGSGPEASLIKKVVQERGLTEAIIFDTNLDDLALEKAYADASAFVLPLLPRPGDMEGFGIVLIEAAARGVPVAAARLGGAPDAVIEGITGQLFEARNAQACAATILQLLRTRQDRQRIASAARERYSWHCLLPLYRDALL